MSAMMPPPMGMGDVDPETAMAMEMMMGGPTPPTNLGGMLAPCTICGANVPVESGAPVATGGMGMGAEGMGAAIPGMGMEMGGGAPPMM